MLGMSMAVLVSCEHATCTVPGGQRVIFEGREEELHSESGWEAGALNLAQGFAMAFRTPLVHGEVTRLLIDLEAGEDLRWGKYADQLSEPARERFGERMWRGYRKTLRQRIEEDLRRHDSVVHVLVHVTGRDAGCVNLRTREGAGAAQRVAAAWADAIRCEFMEAQCPMGGMPGDLVEWLAAGFPGERYLPIRLEVAADYFLVGKPLAWSACKKKVIQGLETALREISG